MTSMVKFTYEIARDIADKRMSMDEAIADFGHIIDRDALEEALCNLVAVRYEEDEDGESVIVIHFE